MSVSTAPRTHQPQKRGRTCQNCARAGDICLRPDVMALPDHPGCPDGFRPSQEYILRRYPRLVGHLICQSLGYLTPRAAANLIIAYCGGREFWCEWISHLHSCGVKNPTRYVLEMAVKLRHTHRGYMADYGLARAIIAQSLAGNDPIFASWF